MIPLTVLVLLCVVACVVVREPAKDTRSEIAEDNRRNLADKSRLVRRA